MTVVLGIDAAWTEKSPSGVALVAIAGRAQCQTLAVAPSYEAFVGVSRGESVDWTTPHDGSTCNPGALLGAAEALAGRSVDIVTVDMPMSMDAIVGRRPADNCVSTRFGARGCSTHSPSRKRPGTLGHEFMRKFVQLGYPLATTRTQERDGRHLVEVYPHTALLSLMSLPERVRYKASKSLSYWPECDIQERKRRLLLVYQRIATALRKQIGSFELPLPEFSASLRFSNLKTYEDGIDALVCCWMGLLFRSDGATPLGDEKSSIWCPKDVV